MKTLALDARPAQRPPHSFRRLLELFFDAAQREELPTELWTDGALHPECEPWVVHTRPFPEADEQREDVIMWCLTPDPPFCAHRPYIAMICDVNPLLPDGRAAFSRWRRGRAFKKKVRYAMEHAWKIATDSEDAKQRLIEAFPGIESKLHVIPLYAAKSLRHMSSGALAPILEKHDLNQGYIFNVGSFRRHKNWEGLLHAYAALPEELKNEHPLVFSGAVHRDKLNAQRLLGQLNLKEHVRILGETAEEDMAALYSGAQLFVFPSFMEGFGLPPLEAMDCGTPVVASNRTSIPEVLGDAARYFDPADTKGMTQAMQEVLEDKALQAEMAAAGTAQAKCYNMSRTGEAIKQMLEI